MNLLSLKQTAFCIQEPRLLFGISILGDTRTLLAIGETKMDGVNEEKDQLLKLSPQKLSGRTTVEVSVTNKKTGERKGLVELDFDSRDEIEVAFTTIGIGGEPSTEAWVFYFGDSVDGEKGSDGVVTRAERQRKEQVFQKVDNSLAEALAENSTPSDPPLYDLTADDYYEDFSIELEDLPIQEHFKVLQDHYQDFLFKFRQFLD